MYLTLDTQATIHGSSRCPDHHRNILETMAGTANCRATCKMQNSRLKLKACLKHLWHLLQCSPSSHVCFFEFFLESGNLGSGGCEHSHGHCLWLRAGSALLQNVQPPIIFFVGQLLQATECICYCLLGRWRLLWGGWQTIIFGFPL